MPQTENKHILGVDLGGTKIHAALYDMKDFKVLKQHRVLTESRDGLQKVLERVAGVVNEVADEQTVAAGLCVPGYFNPKSEVLWRTPNIPFKEPMNLVEFFKTRVKLPMVFDNDANLFAYAEYEKNWKGKIKDMIAVVVGTGLGGGIVIDGKLYRGANGFAGEFGHASFGFDHEFEDFVSGRGDVSQLGKYLGLLLSDVVHVFNPEVIVLGGSVATHTFAGLEKEIWDRIRARNVEESYRNLKITLSTLEHPATLGAALLALESYDHA